MTKEVIFLPVKPNYSNRILDQSKVWEFRKVKPKRPISHLVLYSSSPEKKVRAIVEVKSVFSGSPAEVWEKTNKGAGTTKDFFFSYFQGCTQAHAFKLGKVIPLESFSPSSVGIKVPQSFIYLNKSSLEKIYSYKQKRVFIGGIHGVGKSTLIDSIIRLLPSFTHLVCSDLIKYDKSKLDVKEVDSNQDILVNSLEKLASQSTNILIDGHFALLQKSEPTSVPLSTFYRLKIDSIVILQGSPRMILERLPAARRRNFSEEILSKLQELEIKQGYAIAKYLGIPIVLIDSFESIESIESRMLGFIGLKS